MTKGNTKTAFKFVKFKIPSFSFEEPTEKGKDYNLVFNPKGLYNENTGEFELTLKFKAFLDNVEKPNIKVKAVAYFKFDEKYSFEEIPAHFFLNSIPIFFPYLRSFISTLSLQANFEIIMLGLINFTNLKEPLIKHTRVITKEN